MIEAIADTHAVIWYLYDDAHLSTNARALFKKAAQEGNTIGISTISLIEIVYLAEKGRIDSNALERLFTAIEGNDSVLVEIPVDRHVVQALEKVPWSQVPDMPDRVIAATSLLVGVPLISRDKKISLSEIQTIW